MTALNRLQPHLLTDVPPANRKDLLGVGHNLGLVPMTIRTARKWLENLGFEVRLVKHEHWIITHSRALPELHFYSAVELSQFAAHRAHRYADTITREES